MQRADAPSISTARVQPARLHIPSLDGLRAVSFFIVFLAHAGLGNVIPGGFGVTVFFFLSGFLITTLMRVEVLQTGNVSLSHFYGRRVLRILPPFYVVLVGATLLAVAGIVPGRPEARPVAAEVFHFGNYWFARHGYDGVAAGTPVYWSLAVEEHFYLLFPCLYLGLRRLLADRRSQALALLGLIALVCAWRCWLVLHDGVSEARTYLATDTRFDSILFGCALAIGANPVLDAPVGSARLWKWRLYPAAIVVLLFTFAWRANWFHQTLRYTLQGIALVPLFVSAIRFPEWGPFRFLNDRRVAFVGVLSYSLYLVHQVALASIESWLPTWNAAARGSLALAVSMALSYAIYRCVESPCARLRRRLGLS